MYRDRIKHFMLAVLVLLLSIGCQKKEPYVESISGDIDGLNWSYSVIRTNMGDCGEAVVGVVYTMDIDPAPRLSISDKGITLIVSGEYGPEKHEMSNGYVYLIGPEPHIRKHYCPELASVSDSPNSKQIEKYISEFIKNKR